MGRPGEPGEHLREHTKQELEDLAWAERARKAAKSGFLGNEETEEFIRAVLARKPAREDPRPPA